MTLGVRRGWASFCGFVAAAAWIYAALTTVGGNVDTFGILILMVLATPVIGGVAGLIAYHCLASDKLAAGLIPIFVMFSPAGTVFLLGWISQADERAESRELGKLTDAREREYARLGWRAPSGYRYKGGGPNQFSYAVRDLNEVTKMMDAQFGWDKMDYGQSRYWVKRTGQEMLWAHAYRTRYSSPKVAFEVWRTGDRELLAKVASDLAEDFRSSQGRNVLAKSRATDSVPESLESLQLETLLGERAPTNIEDLVIERDRARIDIGVGYSASGSYAVAFVRVHWSRKGDAWAISKLEALPSRKADPGRQVREEF